MKILIIEDNETKYVQIKESLNRVLEYPTITWMRSRNTGLISLKQHNLEHKYKDEYDLVITDNYMPLYEYDAYERANLTHPIEIKPYAETIVKRIRHYGLDIPVIVCSSEAINECGYDYLVRYDPSTRLDYTFKNIFESINEKKSNLKVPVDRSTLVIKRPKNEIDYTGVLGTALIEHKTGVEDYCSAYDPFGLCNILECLYCENCAYKITLGEEAIGMNLDKVDIEEGNTDPHEILFYDRIPEIDEVFSYLFDEDSRYKVVRKMDNIVMVDKTREYGKTLSLKPNNARKYKR